MNRLFNVIIAGGKTGGHLFPGIAVAQALQRLDRNVSILFVGTDAEFEKKTLASYGYPHRPIFSKPLKGGSIGGRVLSLAVIGISLIQSLFIMKTVRPDFVLGVGGFSSFAVVLAAWILGIPTAIQEQNAFPGLTNRMLSRFARTIFTSFETTRGFEENPKVIHAGNPVRRASSQETSERSALSDLHPDRPTLLVTGGSQGASSINFAFMEALELLNDPDRFNIIHQTGIKDEKTIRERYERLGIRAIVQAFFQDMPKFQDAADLVITRAGAGAVSEICIKALPAILVPFPYAADDHQTFNAKALETKGAAVMIKDRDLTGKRLKQTIDELTKDPDRLSRMAEKLATLAMPDADEKIARHILTSMESKV